VESGQLASVFRWPAAAALSVRGVGAVTTGCTAGLATTKVPKKPAASAKPETQKGIGLVKTATKTAARRKSA
jgi:hypothetical protein